MQMVQVAVKTLKNEASSLDGLKFRQEAAIMGQFKHPNVVALYGVAQKAGKVGKNCYGALIQPHL